MAITIEDFGSSVEQVQHKLSEILPQLENGREVINETLSVSKVHSEAPTGILSAIETGGHISQGIATDISDTCEKVDADIDNAFVDGKKLLDTDLKSANEIEDKIKSVQDTLDDELKSREEKISQSAVTFETNMSTVQEMVSALTTSWAELDSTFTSTRDAFKGKLAQASKSHIEHHEDLIKELNAFESDGLTTITQSGTGPLGLFEDTMGDMKEVGDNAVTEIRKDLDDILKTLRTDRQAVTQGFCEQYQASVGMIPGPLSELSSKAVGELQECKNGSLSKLNTEVAEAQSASEKAKAVLDEVAPKVSDVQEVKENAENMNQAM